MYDESMSEDFSENTNANQNNNQGEQKPYGQYRNPSWQNNGSYRNNYQGNNGGGYRGGQGGGFKPNFNKGNYNKSNYGNRGGYNNQQAYKPKEFDGIAKVYKSFVVASNKEVPSNITNELRAFLPELEKSGFTMRVSSMEGTIDEQVISLITDKEVYLPWKNFNNCDTGNTYTSPESKAIAKLFQPSFDTLSSGIQLILAKNVRIVLGNDSKSPCNFVLCWTEDGAETLKEKTSTTGNIGHLIAVACAAHIPIYNLGKPGCIDRLKRNLNIGSSNE